MGKLGATEDIDIDLVKYSNRHEDELNKLLVVNETYKFIDAKHTNDQNNDEKCTQETEKPPQNKEVRKTKALDGGWGWAVIAAIFSNLFLIQFLGPSYGLLFHGLMAKLEVSSSVNHWVFALQLFIWHVMVIVNGTFIQEFGWRRVAMTGFALLSVAFVTSAFATSGVYLFFSYSLLTGVGGSMIMTSSFYILPIYWEKKRGMATAIAMAGICAGQFVSPVLINYLLETLGFSGCCLIIAALVLNGIPASLMFHPITWHAKEGKLHSSQPQRTKQISTKIKSRRERVHDFFMRIFKTVFSHLSILKRPQAALIAVSVSLTLICVFNFQMNIPYSMTHDEFLFSDAVYGRTIISAASAVGRISAAFLSDFPWFRKQIGFLFGFLLTTASVIGFIFANTIPTIFSSLAVHGLGMGLIMGLYSLVIIDFMGLDKYPATFGSACLCTAFVSITIGPLSGLIKDRTHSIKNSLWLLTSFESIAIILWLFLISKYKIKRK